MQIVKHKATEAVTKVVEVQPAKPETFDLIGLNEEQAVLVALLLGNAAHSVYGNLYGDLMKALDIDNDAFYSCLHGEHGLDPIKTGVITVAHIQHLISKRGR